jgi:hypothetical protein
LILLLFLGQFVEVPTEEVFFSQKVSKPVFNVMSFKLPVKHVLVESRQDPAISFDIVFKKVPFIYIFFGKIQDTITHFILIVDMPKEESVGGGDIKNSAKGGL